MILSAFDMKLHEKKMRYLPGPIDPRATFQKLQKYQKMHEEMGSLPARAGGPGGAAPREDRKNGCSYELTLVVSTRTDLVIEPCVQSAHLVC